MTGRRSWTFGTLLLAIALAAFALAGWVRPAPLDWLLLVAVGVTTQVAQVLMTRVLHLETAGRAVGVGYLQVVFAFGWGWLIFGAEPTATGLVGAALVVASTLLLGVRRE